MLYLDNLNGALQKVVRHALKRETFGVNSVDVQVNGTIFLNGYFTPTDLQLLSRMSADVVNEKTLS